MKFTTKIPVKEGKLMKAKDKQLLINLTGVIFFLYLPFFLFGIVLPADFFDVFRWWAIPTVCIIVSVSLVGFFYNLISWSAD